MRTPLSIAAACLAGALGASSEGFPQSSAPSVWEIILVPTDLPSGSYGEVETVFDPDSILDPENPFTHREREWIIRTRPLSGWLTKAVLSLRDSSNSVFHPEIFVALPVAGGQERISFPTIKKDDPDYAPVAAAYNDEKRFLQDKEDWLSLYMHSEAFIRYVVGGERVSEVFITPTLVRALVVYATSVSNLVKGTDWFRAPDLWNDRKALLERVVRRLQDADSAEALDPREFSTARIERAIENLEEMENYSYKRIWTGFVTLRRELGSRRCRSSFPIAVEFYEHLDGIRARDKDKYEAIKGASGFTRTHVLNEAVACFRELLKIEPGRLVPHPEVVKEEFRGRSASSTGTMLLEDVRVSLDELGCNLKPCEAHETELFEQTRESARFLESALPLVEQGEAYAERDQADMTVGGE